MAKPGRNDPCPCGSGKKYKRCCLAKGEAVSGFTDADRRSAIDGLERFVDEELGAEDDDASAFFYGEYEARLGALDYEWIQASEAVYDMWFFCDWQLEDGRTVLDLFIERNPDLDAGERRYLKFVRESSMRLYEVEDLLPGESITFREIPAGTKVTVRERQGSRSLWRHALVAARAERGRAFIEALATDAIRHHSTVHENVAVAVRDRIRSHVAAGGSDAAEEQDDIPRDVKEELTLDAYARHYRKWLDEPIPALSDHTPREAAQDADLHPKLADLIHGLEGLYQRSLKEGTPAYDPSWMWTELGLAVKGKPRRGRLVPRQGLQAVSR